MTATCQLAPLWSLYQLTDLILLITLCWQSVHPIHRTIFLWWLILLHVLCHAVTFVLSQYSLASKKSAKLPAYASAKPPRGRKSSVFGGDRRQVSYENLWTQINARNMLASTCEGPAPFNSFLWAFLWSYCTCSFGISVRACLLYRYLYVMVRLCCHFQVTLWRLWVLLCGHDHLLSLIRSIQSHG